MVLQKGLRRASLKETKEGIKVLLLIRYKGRDFKLPRLVYLNMCCNDREVFMDIYEELRAMGLEIEVENETPADVSLPRFMLPSDVKVRCAVADDGDVLSSLCDEIRTQAAGNGGVVGFDIEGDIVVRMKILRRRSNWQPASSSWFCKSCTARRRRRRIFQGP